MSCSCAGFVFILVFTALAALDNALSLSACIDGYIEAVSDGFFSNITDHFFKHIETFISIGGGRIHLSEGSKSDALLKIVHCVDVIHPAVINNSQHNHLFHFAHTVRSDFSFLFVVKLVESIYRIFFKLLCRQISNLFFGIIKPVESAGNALEVFVHKLQIPLFSIFAAYSNRLHSALYQIVHHIHNVFLYIVIEKDSPALLVDNLSLLVHYVVILKNVFTDFKVSSFNLLLRVFNCLGKHSCGNRFILHAESVHNGLYSVAAEEPH